MNVQAFWFCLPPLVPLQNPVDRNGSNQLPCETLHCVPFCFASTKLYIAFDWTNLNSRESSSDPQNVFKRTDKHSREPFEFWSVKNWAILIRCLPLDFRFNSIQRQIFKWPTKTVLFSWIRQVRSSHHKKKEKQQKKCRPVTLSSSAGFSIGIETHCYDCETKTETKMTSTTLFVMRARSPALFSLILMFIVFSNHPSFITCLWFTVLKFLFCKFLYNFFADSGTTGQCGQSRCINPSRIPIKTTIQDVKMRQTFLSGSFFDCGFVSFHFTSFDYIFQLPRIIFNIHFFFKFLLIYCVWFGSSYL